MQLHRLVGRSVGSCAQVRQNMWASMAGSDLTGSSYMSDWRHVYAVRLVDPHTLCITLTITYVRTPRSKQGPVHSVCPDQIRLFDLISGPIPNGHES